MAKAGNERPLDSLLFPRRIAVAGLSDRRDAWGRMAFEFLRAGGFGGEVVALRPRMAQPPVRAIETLEAAGVDLVLVAVPAPAAVEIVAEASAAGVAAGVVFSAGFAEDGPAGQLLQDKLVAAAGPMALLGPNCLGLVSGPARVVASLSGFLARPRLDGPVALVSQSGAMGYILAEHLRRRGVGFSFYASTGNEAVLGAAELVDALSRRSEVKVVGAYLEGLRDVAGWRRACRTAAENDCAVVALKVGTSTAARRAAVSHTASAAGDFELFEAVCREEGVTLVGHEVEFAAAVCSLTRPAALPARPGVGIVTMSGGAGAVLADQLAAVAHVPPLSAATRTALQEIGIPLAGDSNPVDLTGMFTRNMGSIETIVSTVARDESVDAVALFLTFGDQRVEAYRGLAERLAAGPTPSWLVWAGAPPGEVERLAGTGWVVASIPDLVYALAAQPRASAVRLVRPAPPADRLPPADSGSEPESVLTEAVLTEAVLTEAVLTEAVLAPALRSRGLRYPEFAVAGDIAEVPDAAARAGIGPPWAVKLDHPAAPHRLSRGLAEIGIPDRASLAAALSRLRERASAEGLEGARYLIETVVSSAGGFSLGALRHPGFGPVVLIGPGGDQVEEAGQRRTAACLPLSDRGLAALAAAAGRLTGRRVDAAALAAAVLAIESLLGDYPGITELDVNPVLLTAAGDLVAVDALGVTAGGQLVEQPLVF